MGLKYQAQTREELPLSLAFTCVKEYKANQERPVKRGFRGWLEFSASYQYQLSLHQGETQMADKGKKDKGKREDQKKAAMTLKEKRKAKQEKKKSK